MLYKLINPGNIIGNHGNTHSHGFHHASGNALQGGGHHEKVETGKQIQAITAKAQKFDSVPTRHLTGLSLQLCPLGTIAQQLKAQAIVFLVQGIKYRKQIRNSLAWNHLADKANGPVRRFIGSRTPCLTGSERINLGQINTIANKTGSGGRNTKARHILNQLFRERHHLIKISQQKGSNLYKSTKLEPHLPGKPVWCAHALYTGAASGNQAEDVRFITMGVDDVDVPFTNHPA